MIALLFAQNKLQAQKCCVEGQTAVKVISDKQVLLGKIDIKEGTYLSNVNTNVYVSYQSGNTQKFWANVAIATVGVAISTQLNSSPITAGDSKSQSAISPIVPLGVSVATLPSIWKNRPRGIPQAGLWIQHRNVKGELIETWEQSISEEAKNSAELLTVAIDKPLSEGTLEIYLQNGNKNEVYFWGLQTLKNVVDVVNKVANEASNKPSLARTAGDCSIDFYIKGTSATTKVTGATDSNDLEAQGWDLVQSIPFDCSGGIDNNGMPNEPNAYNTYLDFIRQASEYNSQNQGGSGGGNGSGNNGIPMSVGDENEESWRKKMDCLYKASTDFRIDMNTCKQNLASDWNTSGLTIIGAVTAGTLAGATIGGTGCTIVLPVIGTVACGAVGAAVGIIAGIVGYGIASYNIGNRYDACANSADLRYKQSVRDCN